MPFDVELSYSADDYQMQSSMKVVTGRSSYLVATKIVRYDSIYWQVVRHSRKRIVFRDEILIFDRFKDRDEAKKAPLNC